MTEFAKEPFDFKRFFLLNGKRVWKVFAAMFAITFLCLVACFLKSRVFAGPEMYQSEALYQIHFEPNLFEKMQHYYNDYTWNDLVDSDGIAGRVAAGSGTLSREQIMEASHVRTMSDMTYMWLEVTLENPEEADRLQEAYGKAMQDFAVDNEAIDAITLEDVRPAILVLGEANYLAYGLGGLVLGFLLGLYLLWYGNAVDDGFYTERDVEARLGLTVYGVHFAEGKQVSGFSAAKEVEGLLEVPYGKKGSNFLYHQCMEAKAKGEPYKGAYITGADAVFYQKYYGAPKG